MLVIVGEANVLGLFGRIFPETGFIRARGGAKINDENAVVVARDGNAQVINARGVIVEENAQMSAARNTQLIVCGNNPKNTISITSRTNDKITLALNRAIKTKTGVCEPLEEPLELLEGFSEFDYMAGFAAALLEK